VPVVVDEDELNGVAEFGKSTCRVDERVEVRVGKVGGDPTVVDRVAAEQEAVSLVEEADPVRCAPVRRSPSALSRRGRSGRRRRASASLSSAGSSTRSIKALGEGTRLALAREQPKVLCVELAIRRQRVELPLCIVDVSLEKVARNGLFDEGCTSFADRDLFELVVPSDVVEVVMRIDDAQRQWRHALSDGANRQDAHSRVEETARSSPATSQV
jgi:hypothetical protein